MKLIIQLLFHNLILFKLIELNIYLYENLLKYFILFFLFLIK